MLFLLSALGSLASAIILIVLIVAVAVIIFHLGKMLAGLVVNSVLGLIVVLIVNSVFGLGITVALLGWILIAIIGLPAVLAIVVLKIFISTIPFIYG